jgi:hypothetical protein
MALLMDNFALNGRSRRHKFDFQAGSSTALPMMFGGAYGFQRRPFGGARTMTFIRGDPMKTTVLALICTVSSAVPFNAKAFLWLSGALEWQRLKRADRA